MMMYTTAIFVALFLAFLLLTKKRRSLPDVFLGVWMIVIGTHLFAYYSYISGIIFRHPDLMWLNLPYAFLHGPLLYLYTMSLTNPEKFRGRRWFLHFVLPLLIHFSDMPVMLLPENERILIYQQDWKGFEALTFTQGVLLNFSGIFYVIITNISLFKHKKRILHHFSNKEKINLDWLRFLFYGMGLIWGIIIFTGNDAWIFSAASVFVVFVGYFGIRQAGIFTNQIVEDESIQEIVIENGIYESAVTKKKYAKSGLNEVAAKDLHLQLQHVMCTGKLFTEPELSLADLAGRLSVHPNYLSQVINEAEGVSFYDYINSLRVEEFKRLVSLPENHKYTLLALAYDCGFNSKSAFNRFFKKETGLSPSAYVKISG